MIRHNKRNHYHVEIRYDNIALFDLNAIHLPDDGKPYSAKWIQELADMITSIGLISCLTGIVQEGKVFIVDGCRRYLALSQLTALGKPYFFHDAEITGKVPVSLMMPLTGSDLAKTIAAAIEYNGISTSEKNKIIDSACLTLRSLEKYGQFTWPPGKKAHWLSVYTGIPEHHIKDYLADLEKIKLFSK